MTLENKISDETSKDRWWILHMEEKRDFLHRRNKNFSFGWGKNGGKFFMDKFYL